MASTNPLANESFIGKIKRKTKADTPATSGRIDAYLIGMNEYVRICSSACAVCWDKPIPEDWNGQAEYLAKRVRIGHTSVLEHSNLVIYLRVDDSYLEDREALLEDYNRYLNVRSAPYKDENGSGRDILIGGSLRGYADLFREADDLNNALLKSISSILYTYTSSACFEDICKLGLMDKSKFMNVEPDENFMLLNTFKDPIETDKFVITNIDSIKILYSNLFKINKEFANKLTTFDLIKFATVTILFKDMSRIITQQLTRHRNAITQESQRYVDYSKACFNSPALFKEKYDPNHKYQIRFGPSPIMNLTLNEIGNAMTSIYGMLSNPATAGADHALAKEDARGYLPSNTQCRKIYITFTYKNLLKFLDLREDRAAQAEIRLYATEIGNWFRSNTDFRTKELCDLYTMPRLLIEDPFKLEADEGIVDEELDVSVEDYIKATGLDVEETVESPKE